jgi:hypothetical protein
MIINPTRKSSQLFSNVAPANNAEDAELYCKLNAFYSWHANSFICDRKECLILVNDWSGLPVMIVDINAESKKHLDKLIVDGIAISMQIAGAKQSDIERYFQIAGVPEIYKAHNRRMITVVNGVDEHSAWVSQSCPIHLDEHFQPRLIRRLMKFSIDRNKEFIDPDEETIESLADPRWRSIKTDELENLPTPLGTIPGLSSHTITDLRRLNIKYVEDLVGRDAEAMVEQLQVIYNNMKWPRKVSRQVAAQYRMYIYYAQGGRDSEKLKWHYWSDKNVNARAVLR